jgi:hypothetical protein
MRADRGSVDTCVMTHSPARCPSCHSSEVVSVNLAVTADNPFAFGFCTQCEWRGWDSEGHGFTLTSILGLAARR